MRMIIVGRSSGALAEYADALKLCRFDAVLVVGKMGEVFPDQIDHWVSFHADLFPKWATTRARNGLPPAACCWGAIYRGRVLHTGRVMPAPLRRVRAAGGSSGYMAVQVALDELGADRVVLAGMPMRAEDGHAASASSPQEEGQPWTEADSYWPTWEANMGKLRDRVRSMSGRTRDALGAPTQEWLLCAP